MSPHSPVFHSNERDECRLIWDAKSNHLQDLPDLLLGEKAEQIGVTSGDTHLISSWSDGGWWSRCCVQHGSDPQEAVPQVLLLWNRELDLVLDVCMSDTSLVLLVLLQSHALLYSKQWEGTFRSRRLWNHLL